MNRRLVVLSAIAALLGAYELAPYLGGLFSSSGNAPALQPSSPPSGGGAVKLNPLQGIEAQSYAAIMERPLFNPGRQPRPAEPVATVQPTVEQPAPPPPPPPPPAPGPDDYRLLGVASGPDGRVAALRVAASNEVVYLRKDDTLDSWSVVDITDRSISIGTPDNPVTFSLFADTGQADVPDQPVPPGQPVPAGQPAPPGQPMPTGAVPVQPIPQPVVPPGMDTEQLPMEPDAMPDSVVAPPTDNNL